MLRYIEDGWTCAGGIKSLPVMEARTVLVSFYKVSSLSTDYIVLMLNLIAIFQVASATGCNYIHLSYICTV